MEQVCGQITWQLPIMVFKSEPLNFYDMFTFNVIVVFPAIVSCIRDDVGDDMDSDQSGSIVTVYDYYDHFTTVARCVIEQTDGTN